MRPLTPVCSKAYIMAHAGWAQAAAAAGQKTRLQGNSPDPVQSHEPAEQTTIPDEVV